MGAKPRTGPCSTAQATSAQRVRVAEAQNGMILDGERLSSPSLCATQFASTFPEQDILIWRLNELETARRGCKFTWISVISVLPILPCKEMVSLLVRAALGGRGVCDGALISRASGAEFELASLVPASGCCCARSATSGDAAADIAVGIRSESTPRSVEIGSGAAFADCSKFDCIARFYSGFINGA
jgi:hypothetical protein